MIIHFITVGQKMPKWVQEGYAEYAKRLPKACSLNLIELPMAQRGKTSSVEQMKAEEAKRILAAIPKGARLIALDEHGQQVTTKGLAEKMEDWLAGGQDIALIVGGPDGLDQTILQQAQWKWGLSKLTMPHPMVRIMVAEQIYRAWSVINNHPYHRE
ncbi:MAG: 23S rRNA (pseudouridine(1915)-N(3))-methyltransferase RlmH [Thiomicrorhabdus chilensis]|uniref:23S rRNA (pseudouridine(1915)-N(3))-methyltransferase RlmH n=1 Tax=Thiomicrorhabdus chilensis TaxID=63656 RepID=UPI00299F0008|nr:23S rRNA (pseudouridine(1915)-N(3))-methyltransferase RlmH [Thiomicrorhabdus chilensis]MDX1347199.1 23S rRNA (pseudouridine(1915)-N(3))-methyltransferase RlmH [Thiomicrorhabdus chilensis]